MNEKLKEKIKTFSERTPNDMASKLVNARELIDGMATFIDENFKGLIEMKTERIRGEIMCSVEGFAHLIKMIIQLYEGHDILKFSIYEKDNVMFLETNIDFAKIQTGIYFGYIFSSAADYGFDIIKSNGNFTIKAKLRVERFLKLGSMSFSNISTIFDMIFFH